MNGAISLSEAHDATEAIERKIIEQIPMADVTIHVEPVPDPKKPPRKIKKKT